ncbi:MAG: radical SAM protein [Acidobacteria bacterium]|nr:MAG: radical SAM protein [Acidobacteriota bacterium]
MDGVSFTRQGRCQERDDVLGTTKPPLSLAWIASVLRQDGHDARIIDLTAAGKTVGELAHFLDEGQFAPTLIIFASCFPTWDADARAMGALKEKTGAPIISFGPHASAAPIDALKRAPVVDGVLVGEPEDGARALANLQPGENWSTVGSLCFRRGDDIVPCRESGRFGGFASAAGPDWGGTDFDHYRLPLVNAPYALVETSRGCPYTCDFCVAPLQQGHQFRERPAPAVVDEIERLQHERRLRYFYLWGDTVTLNQKSIGAIADELIRRRLGIRWIANARADNVTDPALVSRLRASGCWMLSFGIEASVPERRDEMQKRLPEPAIASAVANLRRAGIRSFAFFIFGYPGETLASMAATTDYACDLDIDFAGFYPAVPYPGTELGDRAAAVGWVTDPSDWRQLEYSHYAMKCGELTEASVLKAIARARRRFYLRPRYLARHAWELARIAATKPGITKHVVKQMLARRD